MKRADVIPNNRATLLQARAHFEAGLAVIREALGEQATEAAMALEPEYVSLKEAARRLVCSVDTVKRDCLKFDCGGPTSKGSRWSVNFTRLAAERRYRGKRSI
jgi:hypothetical protein